jgi:hypothetical protein
MNHLYKSTAALLITLLIPSAAFAEFRSIELKILGLD